MQTLYYTSDFGDVPKESISVSAIETKESRDRRESGQRVVTDVTATNLVPEPLGKTTDESSINSAMESVQSADEQPTVNPVLQHLMIVLEDFGKVEGEDYTLADLSESPTLETVYPQYASTEVGKVDSEWEYGTIGSLRYWYHPDYLRSVDLITDEDAVVYQYFIYNPWGEQLQEYKATGVFDSPYRFNGKELDDETGLAYYGARYYDNQLSMWLSVDPLAMSGHNIMMTPYHFTSNNPVMRVDPDGLTDFVNAETGELVTVDDGMNQEVSVGSEDWEIAVGHSQLTDGANPDEIYNDFITSNGGTAVPTSSNGGWIEDRDLFMGFMQFRASIGDKEVAAWEFPREGSNDQDYFVQPWVDNIETKHKTSPTPINNPYGYTDRDAKRVWHTHPFKWGYISKGLSYADWYEARNLGMPNRVIYPDGSVWELMNAPRESILPRSLTGFYGQKVLNP